MHYCTRERKRCTVHFIIIPFFFLLLLRFVRSMREKRAKEKKWVAVVVGGILFWFCVVGHTWRRTMEESCSGDDMLSQESLFMAFDVALYRTYFHGNSRLDTSFLATV